MISYKAKQNTNNLNNFIDDKIINIDKNKRKEELMNSKEILTPNEMKELEDLI